MSFFSRKLGIRFAATVFCFASFGGAFNVAAVNAQEFQPKLPDVSAYVEDEHWARVLGKALFWDMQVGSDGMACATCHFSAGADSRIKNQLNPNFTNISVTDGNGNPVGDTTFGTDNSMENGPDPFPGMDNLVTYGKIGLDGKTAAPNHKLRPQDFPLHKLEDVSDRNSTIIQTSNDRVSSAGSFDNTFVKIAKGRVRDRCRKNRDTIFKSIHGKIVRQVEPRNTPTMINAVYNNVQFWDGRARNTFNGFGVFGKSETVNNPLARVLKKENGSVTLVPIAIPHGSLASQAVGPPLSALEMSCDGREFAELGRKMISSVKFPLKKQKVSRYDSLLGPYAKRYGRGLKFRHSYKALIKKAFKPEWWSARGRYNVYLPDGAEEAMLERTRWRDKDGFTQMERNFTLFFGIAVMMYEQTLISDESRFDAARKHGPANCEIKFPAGPGPFAGSISDECIAPANSPGAYGTLTKLEVDGYRLFNGAGGCVTCHTGPFFSDVTEHVPANGQIGSPTFDILNGPIPIPGPNPPILTLEPGFHNVGVRPTWEDTGVGGTDPFGIPLSTVRFAKRFLNGVLPDDALEVTIPNGKTVAGIGTLLVDGSMKTPSLRNVALTPPYFHYGGFATLDQVVEFYARAGNARNRGIQFPAPAPANNTSGSGPDGDSLAAILSNPNIPNGNNSGLIAAGPLNLALDAGCIDEISETGEAIAPSTPGCRGQNYGKSALVAFLKSLTDPKVQCDKAPFDHPALKIRHGHKKNGKDINVVLPAVGAQGYKGARANLCVPNAGDLFGPGMQNRVTRIKKYLKEADY